MNAEWIQVWADIQEDLGLDTALARACAGWLSGPRVWSGSLGAPTLNTEYLADEAKRDGYGDGGSRITQSSPTSEHRMILVVLDGSGSTNGDGFGGGNGSFMTRTGTWDDVQGNGFGQGEDSYDGDGGDERIGDGYDSRSEGGF